MTTSTDRSVTTIHFRAAMLSCALLALVPLSASAQSGARKTEAAAHHAHATSAANALDVPASARAAVDVVDAFGKALSAADLAQVERLLDPAVIVLETGGAERSREEYLGHHAAADAAFLASAHVSLVRRIARADGATAWVASESEIHALKDGKAVTLRSTETMVLAKAASGEWRIVHIHWSSRPKKS